MARAEQAQPSPYRLQALRIIPGDAASARSFHQANRIKSALLILSPRRAYRILSSRDPLVDRGRSTDPYWAVLPEPAATTCATFVIEEVYSGAAGGPAGTGNGGQTAIAELRFFTELDFQGGAEQLLRDLDGADLPRGAAAVTALSRLGLLGVELAGGKPARDLGHGGACVRLTDEQAGTAGELGESGLTEDALDRAHADVGPLVFDDLGDLANRELALLAQLDDAGADADRRTTSCAGDISGPEGKTHQPAPEAVAKQMHVAG